MRKFFVLAFTILVLLAPLCANAATTPSKEAIKLFNGENLGGFYTFIKDRGRDVDPKQVFTVEDGMLHISGEEWGCVTSDEEYADFHLIVEFKWGEKTWANRVESARDSGVLVHSTGEDGGYSGIWMRGLELQMIEGGTGDLLVVGDSTENYAMSAHVKPEKDGGSYVFQPDGAPVTINGGRINWWGRDPAWEDKINYRGPQDVESPLGEWNKYEALCEDGTITVILNGVVVNRAFDVKPRAGRIQVQSEGAEVFVRRVDLLPLPEK